MKSLFKGLSLNNKLLILITFFSAFIIVIIIVLYTNKTKKADFSKADLILESKVKDVAYLNKIEFERTFLNIKSVFSIIEGYRSISDLQKRNYFIQALSKVVENNPEFTGIGMIWEPYAFDGLDSMFNDSPYSSGSGSFIPYISNSNGIINVEQFLNYENSGWYTNCKTSLKDYYSEPILKNTNNELSLVVNCCFPFINNNTFKGLLYFEITFNQLTQKNNQFKTYKTAYCQLINHNGIILTHPDKKQLNKMIPDFKDQKSEILDAVFKGNNYYLFKSSDKHTVNAISAVKVNHFTNPLFLVITVPDSEVYSNYRVSQIQSILVGIFVLIIIVVISFISIQKITKPLKYFTRNIETIATTGKIKQLSETSSYLSNELFSMSEAIKKLTEELNKKNDFANEIKDGRLNTEYHPLGKDDTLGISLLEIKKSLIESVEDEKIRKFEDDKRNWTAEGQAKFAELLRKNNDNIELLSYELIKNLVKYINANQGGVFLLNEENINEPFLELVACFAYDRQKFLTKKIMIGEGLVGTCYLEKKSVYLTKVPESYLNITSGLGDSNPSTLLIVPLRLNEYCYGVLELASFDKIEHYQVDFVEKIAEIIASTISGVKINIKTANLLKQSQEQAEEMKSQEEEMRQNMEELTATQESLAEKDAIKQKEIERLNELLSEKNSELFIKEEEFKKKAEILYQEMRSLKEQTENQKHSNINDNNYSDMAATVLHSFAHLTMDHHTIISSCNDLLKKQLNKNDTDLIGKSFTDIFPGIDHKDEFIKKLITGLKNNHVHYVVLSYINEFQDETWFNTYFYPVFDNQNTIKQIFVCIFNVTENIKEKNNLIGFINELNNKIELLKNENNELKNKFQVPQNDMPVLPDVLSKTFIYEEYNMDGEIIKINELSEKTFEYLHNDVKGKNIITLIPDKSKKEFRMIWDSTARGKFFKGETGRLKKSGNEIWLNSIYFPLTNDSGKVHKIVFIGYELTATKNLEKENQLLAEKIKELEMALKKSNIRTRKS